MLANYDRRSAADGMEGGQWKIAGARAKSVLDQI
jgi:hypothetical protein